MSELVDLVDKSGRLVEVGVDRALAEKRTDAFMRIVVLVIVNRKGEVLYHQRHSSKRFESNKIDHVCGAVKSGETLEQAGIREALEEVGVMPTNLVVCHQGVNVYGYYRVLFIGKCDQFPVVDPVAHEANFASYATIEELREMYSLGTYEFVDDFFSDYQLCTAYM